MDTQGGAPQTAEAPGPVTGTTTAQPWKFGDPTPNLNAALAALQGEMPEIPKTKTGKISGQNKKGEWYEYEYYYADLADISKAAGPLMAKHGLSFSGQPKKDPDDKTEMILRWKLKHASGEEDSGDYPLGPVRQKPQALGSMVTYARRYCKCSALDIVADEDDDGARAQALGRSSNNNSAGDGTSSRNGNGRSGADFDNATAAAPPGNAKQNDEAAPLPLEPGDPWSPAIEAIHTIEDAETAEKELRRAYLADEINSDRASQVKQWIRVKAAPMRSAAKSAAQRDTGKPADPPTDEGWVADYMHRLNTAELDGMPTRGEIGRAVAARKITTEDGAALSAEWVKRKRELEAAAQQQEASAA